jgi:transcriptional regulator with XRE-family HTH domain
MEKEFLKEFGRRTRYLRELTNTTQEDLRKALGYSSTGAISQVENGSKGMKLDAIAKAADFFGVHPAVMLSPVSIPKSELMLVIKMMNMIKRKEKHKNYQEIMDLLNNKN